MKDIRFSKKKIDSAWKEGVNPKNVSQQPQPETHTDSTDKQNSTQFKEKINFSSFISSIGLQTLMHLGDIANPATNKKEVQIQVAQELIDILTILEEKTKSNLSPDEAKLLSSLLYDLRMRFLEKQKTT